MTTCTSARPPTCSARCRRSHTSTHTRLCAGRAQAACPPACAPPTTTVGALRDKRHSYTNPLMTRLRSGPGVEVPHVLMERRALALSPASFPTACGFPESTSWPPLAGRSRHEKTPHVSGDDLTSPVASTARSRPPGLDRPASTTTSPGPRPGEPPASLVHPRTRGRLDHPRRARWPQLPQQLSTASTSTASTASIVNLDRQPRPPTSAVHRPVASTARRPRPPQPSCPERRARPLRPPPLHRAAAWVGGLVGRQGGGRTEERHWRMNTPLVDRGPRAQGGRPPHAHEPIYKRPSPS